MMNFNKMTNTTRDEFTTQNPEVWERLLNSLPEGSELILDECGNVIGVEVHIICLFETDNDENNYDKIFNKPVIEYFKA